MEFNRVVAHAEVERVFNGAPAESVDVEFLRLDLPSSLARLDEGERAVLFLRRRDGRYGLVDPSTAKIPVDRVDEQTRRALLEARDGAAGEVARIATEILSAIAVTPG